MENIYETATFGGGCFWCVEAVFQELQGVDTVVPGYAGGHTENPSYQQVCSGDTGHAEVARIRFDPEVISYAELLDVFWQVHDPTTPNRQGHDVGTQYRSAIFCHDDEQLRLAEQSKRDADASGLWPNPIVTEIAPLRQFYPAEEYHRNYFALNPNQPYCQVVVGPKVKKFREHFQARLKASEATTAFRK